MITACSGFQSDDISKREDTDRTSKADNISENNSDAEQEKKTDPAKENDPSTFVTVGERDGIANWRIMEL